MNGGRASTAAEEPLGRRMEAGLSPLPDVDACGRVVRPCTGFLVARIVAIRRSAAGDD
jgi:hypothetical protein